MKARSWNVRLSEEIRENKDGVFVTLTFNEESINELTNYISSKYKGKRFNIKENEIATLAVRRFLERWRKKHKKSVKHWLITELGHEGTKRIHLHGIIFTKNKEDIAKIWGYGYVFLGTWVNEQTINYIIKYVTKTDPDNKYYTPRIS